jgi:hypothetical protein
MRQLPLTRNPMVNEDANIGALARQILLGIDDKSQFSSVPTQSLIMLLCCILNFIDMKNLESSKWQKRYFDEINKTQKELKDKGDEIAKALGG